MNIWLVRNNSTKALTRRCFSPYNNQKCLRPHIQRVVRVVYAKQCLDNNRTETSQCTRKYLKTNENGMRLKSSEFPYQSGCLSVCLLCIKLFNYDRKTGKRGSQTQSGSNFQEYQPCRETRREMYLSIFYYLFV